MNSRVFNGGMKAWGGNGVDTRRPERMHAQGGQVVIAVSRQTPSQNV